MSTTDTTPASQPGGPEAPPPEGNLSPAELEQQWRGYAEVDSAEEAERMTAGRMGAGARQLLGELLRPYKKSLWFIGAIVVLENVSRLSIPYLVKVGIDKGVPAGVLHTTTLCVVVGLVLVATVVQALSRNKFLVGSGLIGQEILFELRSRVFRHFQALSPAFHDGYTSGRVISRQTSDIENIYEMIETGFDGLIASLLTLVGTVVLLLWLNLELGAIAIICLPFLIGLVTWFRRESSRTYRETRGKVAMVIVHFVETMNGMRAVQAFRREPRNQEIFDDVDDQYRAVNVRAFRLVAIFMPGVVLVGNLTIGVVLLVGGYLAYHGHLTVGTLAAFLLYLRQFFSPMQDIRSSTTPSSRRRPRWRSWPTCWRSSRACPSRPTRSRWTGHTASSASTRPGSSTSRAGRCCPASTSPCRPVRRSRWSAPPAPARPPSPSWPPASTTRWRARCGSTASTCVG